MRKGGLRSVRRTLVPALALALGVALTPSRPASASGEASRLLQLINSARAQSGIGPVAFDGTLASIAQSHARRMAAEGRIYHNPSYPGSAGAWEAWGENVGTAPDVDAAHRAFMASSTHRRVLLNPAFTRVGIGVAYWSQGIMVVEDFIRRPGDSASAPAPPRVAVSRPAAPRAPPAQPAPPPPPPPPPVVEPTEPLGCHWVGSPDAG
jgi:hypothetical protein